MILACHNISKAFGEQVIVKSGSFHIEDREKTALIGPNGAGKSTILKMIMKELDTDSGDIILTKGKTIGYLSQHQELSSGNTILEELKTAKADIIEMEKQIRTIEMELKHLHGEDLENRLQTYHRLTERFEHANGYAYQSELVGVLKGLGFREDEFLKEVDTLSGGQKTRVSLGKLLLTKPDILLLDEPTNHLDMNSISWLETYLLNYDGAVLIVSHDRYFLNRVVTKVVEIEYGSIMTYMGNYSDYAQKKKMIREAKLKEYLNQQQEIKHQEAVIEKLRSFNREKSIRRAESREKMLQKIEVLDKPVETRADMRMELHPRIMSGNDVLDVENLAKAFGPERLFEGLSFSIKRGEHVAVIGDNGTGKTTILKIINGLVEQDAGNIRLGTKVHIGYYDQEHHVLHPDKTLFEEISDEYPALTNTEIRNVLAAFLFTGDDVFKQIKMLSGGERGRVSLAKLMLSEANFLILDEPTNHLDIMSKEILEDAINSYSGTVLYVSHDRYFINRTASRILELCNGGFTGYLGNYDYYLEKKAENTVLSSGTGGAFPPAAGGIKSEAASAASSSLKQDWQSQKEAQAALRKKENALKRCEEQIERLETRSQEIDAEMLRPEVCTDVARLQALAREKEQVEEELLLKMEEWESLSD